MHSKILRLMAAVALGIVAAPQTFALGAQHSGIVLETMSSGGYTYMKVEEGGVSYWAAGPATKLAVGDRVSFTERMRMQGFTSSTLNRTFDELVFVSGVSGGGDAGAPAVVGPAAGPVEPVAKAQGGQTVAEVFARKDELKGHPIKVRGRVVKVSLSIMGRNWVHLEDGTGSVGSNRIVFRSPTASAEVGEVVTAEGTLDTDRDFGYGYRYPVLVEDSTFSR